MYLYDVVIKGGFGYRHCRSSILYFKLVSEYVNLFNIPLSFPSLTPTVDTLYLVHINVQLTMNQTELLQNIQLKMNKMITNMVMKEMMI